MKVLYILFSCFPFLIFSQVGINTANPTHTLDVNGSLRVRGITQAASNAAARDSIMAFDSDGVVKYVSATSIASLADAGSVKVVTNATLSFRFIIMPS